MFRKPFTVKSNTNMRNSDRRKLLGRLHCADAIPSKAQAAHVKLISNTGVPVNVYTFDKNPFLFEIEGDPNLYPTAYFCWMAPEAFPTLLVHEPVFSFLENGADLMLPGVVYRRGALPEFDRNTPVTVSVITRNGSLKGPVGVGVSLMSSMEMAANGMQGRGLQMLHLYRDLLWEFGSREHPPQVTLPTVVVPSSQPLTMSNEEFPALGELALDEGNVNKSGDINVTHQSPAIEGSPTPEDVQEKAEETPVESETMEELLERCFLAALKYRVTKKTSLPLDVGEFYARFLLKCVPPSRRIDMKKTKFKKFGVFLAEVNSTTSGPLLKLTSKGKGIDVISEINWSHPLLSGFERKDEVTEDAAPQSKTRIRIDEYLAVTEPVLPLFKPAAGLSRGDLITTPQMREIITTYVKNRELTVKSKVSLRDDVLGKMVKHDSDTIDWNSLIQKIAARMTKTFVIVTPDGRENVHKLKLPKVVFKVETRSGNKKITLVNNLSVYGVECKTFCHQIQVGIATSATIVNDAVQCEGPQVVIQGNQIQFASELLSSEYGLDRKYMDGLELIPKKKR